MHITHLKAPALFALAIGAAVLAAGATSAATMSGIGAAGSLAILHPPAEVVQVRQNPQSHYVRRSDGNRGWRHKNFRHHHKWRHRGHGWRGGYRGRGYVTPFWGYSGYYFGPPAYYGTPYDSYAEPPAGGRCDYWRQQCVRNWGDANPNYYGCMRYERCL